MVLEATDRGVKFDDIEPCLIARVIVYCYHPLSFPQELDTSLFATSGQAPLVDKFADATSDNYMGAELASELYALADRWSMPELMDRAKVRLLWKYYSGNTSMAQPHLIQDLDRFAAIARSVYTTTPSTDRTLRDIVAKSLIKRKRADWDRADDLTAGTPWLVESFTTYRLESLLEELPTLAIDVAMHAETSECFICNRCRSGDQWHILRSCACTKSAIWCYEAKCKSEDVKRSTCTRCHGFGCVSRGARG